MRAAHFQGEGRQIETGGVKIGLLANHRPELAERFFLIAVSRMGDRHVYGAKSRFMTQAVLACMEPVAWGEAAAPEDVVVSGGRVDVASRLRGMWT